MGNKNATETIQLRGNSMKTRQELILEFMLALSAGIYATEAQWVNATEVYNDACLLADVYLGNI
jgi:hypothetical protein